MKKCNFLLLFLLCTTAVVAQEIATRTVKVRDARELTSESPICVASDSSSVRLKYELSDVVLFDGDIITKVAFWGYNTGGEVKRHVRLSVPEASVPRNQVVLFDGDCVIPQAGTAEEPVALLELEFTEPYKFRGKFEATIESTGDVSDTPVYFECNSRKRAAAVFTVQSEVAYLEGFVKMLSGDPVSGANVSIYRYDNDAEAVVLEYGAISDEDGRYKVRVEESNCTYEMRVSAEGYPDYVHNYPFSVTETTGTYPKPSGDIVLRNRLDFYKNQRATIILPDVPDASLGRYYRLDHREEGRNIIFVREYEPKANVPYVIFPERDFSLDLSVYDAKLLPDTVFVPFPDNDRNPYMGFYGSYCSATVFPGSTAYLIDETPDCTLPIAPNLPRVGAFRAYLQTYWDSNIQQQDAHMMTFKDDSTGIESLLPAAVRTPKTYDLQGRSVKQPLKKGVYIRDGKKVSVK